MWDIKKINVLPFFLPGLADADENCKRFMDRCMHEAFKKVRGPTAEVKVMPSRSLHAYPIEIFRIISYLTERSIV